ncbi:inovirus Gp2 family protein [Aeromonas veronii]|nr:inovirus Gp2 family protein [Aeromonas veronii]
MNLASDYILSQQELNNLLAEADFYYGSIERVQLIRIMQVVTGCLDMYSRVCAMRVDLRFPQTNWKGEPDIPICFPRVDSQVITRFFESLKSQLRAEHLRKGRRGSPSLPEYIWVREQDESPLPHYHVVLLFHKDVYAFLGNYTNHEADNMATRIQRAWCSALSLSYPDYSSLVHFPANPVYVFDRCTAAIYSTTYHKFLLRIAYLAKVRTKVTGTRNFGCSQGTASR